MLKKWKYTWKIWGKVMATPSALPGDGGYAGRAYFSKNCSESWKRQVQHLCKWPPLHKIYQGQSPACYFRQHTQSACLKLHMKGKP